MAVLQNHVDNAVRDVYVYYGTGGNIHCRKGSKLLMTLDGLCRYALAPPAVKNRFNSILEQGKY